VRSQLRVNWNVTVDGAALFQALNGQFISDGSVFCDDLVGFESDNFADAEPGVYADGE